MLRAVVSARILCVGLAMGDLGCVDENVELGSGGGGILLDDDEADFAEAVAALAVFSSESATRNCKWGKGDASVRCRPFQLMLTRRRAIKTHPSS